MKKYTRDGVSLKRGWINLFSIRIPRLLPELGELEYFTMYPSPPSSGTNLGFLIEKRLIQPRLVPEPTKLGYQSGLNHWKEGCFISLFSKYPDWYPSPPNSGTNLGILKRGWWISLFSISFNGLVSWWNSTEISESSVELLGKTSESGSTLEWW